MTKWNIKDIEKGYKAKFGTKKINKKTNKWKRFYREYTNEWKESQMATKKMKQKASIEKKPKKISRGPLFEEEYQKKQRTKKLLKRIDEKYIEAGVKKPKKNKPQKKIIVAKKALGQTIRQNGRFYVRSNTYYSTRIDVNKAANLSRNKGINAIVDKRKDGYFLWKSNRVKRKKRK